MGAPASSPLDRAGVRRVGDARTMRALAHPVRISLIEALTLSGPMTATQAGERIGESPTTCSFHLRQLARYGVVEEVGGGKGRARPWKMSQIGMSLSVAEGDSAAGLALRALEKIFLNRFLERFDTFLTLEHTLPKEWKDASEVGDYVLHLTAQELAEVTRKLQDLLLSFHDRMTDPSLRPEGSQAVEAAIFAFPIGPLSPTDPAAAVGSDRQGSVTAPTP